MTSLILLLLNLIASLDEPSKFIGSGDESGYTLKGRGVNDDVLRLLWFQRTRLVSLDLMDCPITDAGLLALACFPNLGQLRIMGGTRVTPDGLSQYLSRSTHKLRYLEVGFLKPYPPPATKWVTALSNHVETIQVLEIRGYRVAPDDLAVLARMKDLRDLMLVDVNVDASAIRCLETLPNLKDIGVFQTELAPRTLELIRKSSKSYRTPPNQ
jgi:hypothetical protein